MVDNGQMKLQMLKGCNLEDEAWPQLLRRIMSIADVGEPGQYPPSSAAVAPNPGSRSNSGQDVSLRSGMCTPFSGGQYVRVGETAIEGNRGFVGNASPNPSSNPVQSLCPSQEQDMAGKASELGQSSSIPAVSHMPHGSVNVPESLFCNQVRESASPTWPASESASRHRVDQVEDQAGTRGMVNPEEFDLWTQIRAG